MLNGEDAEKVQALLCIGLSKLVLAGIVSDERVRAHVDCDVWAVFSDRAYTTGLEESRSGLSLARYR